MAYEEEDKRQPVFEDEEEAEGGVYRWMSALVVLLAVAGFFGLAWYAYKNGSESVDERDVELVKADKTPVKEAPANPGGMQIPNQDKTVYGLISDKIEKPVVERILPAPEEPIARGGDTETWMRDTTKDKPDQEAEANSSPVTPAMSKPQFDPGKLKATHADGTPMVLADATPAPAAKPAAPAVPPVAPAPAVSATPVPIAAKSTSTPALPPAPPPAKAVIPPAQEKAAASKDSDDADDSEKEKPVTKQPVSATPPAGVRVQLGAYKSQGEAESNWTKISREFSDDISGKQHYIVRADLGAKGTYYRLQLAPFVSSSDAEQFCIDFVSAGQACIPAKGK